MMPKYIAAARQHLLARAGLGKSGPLRGPSHRGAPASALFQEGGIRVLIQFKQKDSYASLQHWKRALLPGLVLNLLPVYIATLNLEQRCCHT